MNRRDLREWPRTVRFAAAALAAAIALDVAAIMHARSLGSMETTPPISMASAPHIVLMPVANPGVVRAAASRSPFDAPGAVRVMNPVLAAAPIATPPLSRPRLVGTVSQSQGAFVILQLPDARMQVVRVGERAAGLRLRSVASGEALFDDINGERVLLRTSSPGAEPRP